MTRRSQVTNSAKCEGCTYCELRKWKNDKLDLVYCADRDKQYVWGQYIAPCENYKKEEK